MVNLGARFANKSAEASVSGVVTGFATLGAVAINSELDKVIDGLRGKPELIFGVQ